MNPITYVLKMLETEIPREILNLAFSDPNVMISVDDAIASKVLRSKVLLDCSLIGGIEISVNLQQCSVNQVPNSLEYIVAVPKALTNNNSIVCPLSLIHSPISGMQFPTSTGNGSGLDSRLSSIVNANFGAIPLNTTKMECIGDNIILIQVPTVLTITTGVLKVMVENNSNFSNLNPRLYLKYLELSLLAIKAYIYNNLKIRINKGVLYGGHELSAISEFIDSYSDASSMYREELVKWKKLSILNNKSAIESRISSFFGSNM